MKRLFGIVSFIFIALSINAQSVTLTVTGNGQTKDIATRNALRDAIEQTYGTFVSANTKILDDEIVVDEIVSVANGTVEEYKEVSSYELPDGKGWLVCIQATVSTSKLTAYAQNKGQSTEFAGNTFGMNFKLFKLQQENVSKVLDNLATVVESIMPYIFDVSLTVSEPTMALDNDHLYHTRGWSPDALHDSEHFKGIDCKYSFDRMKRHEGFLNEFNKQDNAYVVFKVKYYPNKKNMAALLSTIRETLNAISITPAEANDIQIAFGGCASAIMLNYMTENSRASIYSLDEKEQETSSPYSTTREYFESLNIPPDIIKVFEKALSEGKSTVEVEIDGKSDVIYLNVGEDKKQETFNPCESLGKYVFILNATPESMTKFQDRIHLSRCQSAYNFEIVDNNGTVSSFNMWPYFLQAILHVSTHCADSHSYEWGYHELSYSEKDLDEKYIFIPHGGFQRREGDFSCFVNGEGIFQHCVLYGTPHWFINHGFKSEKDNWVLRNVVVDSYEVPIYRVGKTELNIIASVPISEIGKYSSFEIRRAH